MKRQIRRGVFETNSSSVHSITMCMKSEYDRWVAGELVWNRWLGELVEITPEIKANMEKEYSPYIKYEQFDDYYYMEYETFYKEYETSNSEKVVAFGYYGENR